MSSTESYTELLDLGREKLSEGDYLKLANFLQTLHKEAEPEEILRVTKYTLDAVLSFDTYKGKKYTVKVDRQESTVFRGSKPDKRVVCGSVNGQAFQLEKDEFCQMWARRMVFHGMKNIERSLLGSDTETFKTIKEFKNLMQERANDEADDDDDPEDVLMWGDTWLMLELFGIRDL